MTSAGDWPAPGFGGGRAGPNRPNWALAAASRAVVAEGTKCVRSLSYVCVPLMCVGGSCNVVCVCDRPLPHCVCNVLVVYRLVSLTGLSVCALDGRAACTGIHKYIAMRPFLQVWANRLQKCIIDQCLFCNHESLLGSGLITNQYLQRP